MKFLLILCQPQDAAAFRLADFCRARHLPVRVVTGPELAAAPTWHVQATTAGTSWRIVLADGTALTPDTVAAVYCRLLGVLSPYSFAHPEDAEYAAAELQALLGGWLRHAAVPLLNPVDPVRLAQPPANGWRQLQQLAAAGLPVPATACLTAPARWAGLPAIPFSRAHPDWARRDGTWLQEPLLPDLYTALVVGNAVLHAPAPELRAPLRRLSQQLDMPLLAVSFARTPGGEWRAAGYHLRPDWATAEEADAFLAFIRLRLPALASPSLAAL